MKIARHENNESGTHCIVNTHFMFVRVSLNGDFGDIAIALGWETLLHSKLKPRDVDPSFA